MVRHWICITDSATVQLPKIDTHSTFVHPIQVSVNRQGWKGPRQDGGLSNVQINELLNFLLHKQACRFRLAVDLSSLGVFIGCLNIEFPACLPAHFLFYVHEPVIIPMCKLIYLACVLFAALACPKLMHMIKHSNNLGLVPVRWYVNCVLCKKLSCQMFL